MSNSILTSLVNSINSFASQFRENLHDYLSEYDVQFALFAKLRNDVASYVDVDGIGNNKKYKLNLIYAEYLQDIDICCLDMDEIRTIKNSEIYKSNKGHDDFIYQLPVLLAIELKFIKGERGRNFLGVLKDEEKLKNADKKDRIKNYLCICFTQSEKITQRLIKSVPSGVAVSEVVKIEKFNTSYIISPERIYTLTKI